MLEFLGCLPYVDYYNVVTGNSPPERTLRGLQEHRHPACSGVNHGDTLEGSDLLLWGACVCMIKGCKCRTPRFTSFLFQRGSPRRVLASCGIIPSLYSMEI
ncbi:unnamed protein product [Pipistrellus nathusii]|uniref:Uncharacterized protein n=1 Tax=Pipistrellus nathusii TaxID=59473 RepID=A0ABN9ZSY9_PIPNA